MDKSTETKYIKEEIEKCEIDKKVNTIYFGGGTPSILEAKDIEEILRIAIITNTLLKVSIYSFLHYIYIFVY